MLKQNKDDNIKNHYIISSFDYLNKLHENIILFLSNYSKLILHI